MTFGCDKTTPSIAKSDLVYAIVDFTVFDKPKGLTYLI